METSFIAGLKTIEVIITFIFGLATIFGADFSFTWACCASVFAVCMFILVKFKCYEPLQEIVDSFSEE